MGFDAASMLHLLLDLIDIDCILSFARLECGVEALADRSRLGADL
jgi:hypothetical protein